MVDKAEANKLRDRGKSALGDMCESLEYITQVVDENNAAMRRLVAERDRLRQQLAEMRLERDDKELAWQECLTMRETENGWRQAAEAERDRLRQQLAEAREEVTP